MRRAGLNVSSTHSTMEDVVVRSVFKNVSLILASPAGAINNYPWLCKHCPTPHVNPPGCLNSPTSMLTRRLSASNYLSSLRKIYLTPRLRLRLRTENDPLALLRGRTRVRWYAQQPPGGGFPRGFQGMNIDGASPAKGEALKEFVSCRVHLARVRPFR
jgi:hypothetical protein